MISKLNSISNNKKEAFIPIRLVINSFSGNSIEFSQSEQIINYFNSKNIKIIEILDLNQEMVFEKSKKLQGSFRSQYNKVGKLMKIDKTPLIPQIIFNETLAINFSQFTLLAELNLIDKIATGKLCSHFRFFEDKIVYPKINFNCIANNFSLEKEYNNFLINFINSDSKNCIYCLSNKKQLKRVKFFCNFRNSYDEETNRILEFCEANGITLNIFDCENLNYFSFPSNNKSQDENLLEFYKNNSKSQEEKILLIDDQSIQIENFFDKIGLSDDYSKSQAFKQCFICQRKILYKKPLTEKNEISKKVNKCEICIKKGDRNFSYAALDDKKHPIILRNNNFKNLKNKLSNQEKINNRYNFIRKLKINEFYSENPEKSFFEKEEKIIKFNTKIIKPINLEISYNLDNSELNQAKSIENDFSFLELNII